MHLLKSKLTWTSKYNYKHSHHKDREIEKIEGLRRSRNQKD